MNSLTLPLHRLPGAIRDPLPARACGRRQRHTRRYVTSLITLARATDAQAIDRLRQRARRCTQPGVLGLTMLADTLVLVKPQPPRSRYPAR